jgi:DNA (cytosine-5)-methyltransferase 1
VKVLDLFSGIGGFSLGLERAGMETVAFCEFDKKARLVLKKHWPNIPIYEDVRELTGERIEKAIGTIDLICGGFPCQPFSVAGNRKGKDDDRHLWPEYFRLIKEIRPRWVIGENVAGLINMGLDQVLSDLESEDYTAETLVIPACAVNAPHRRDRVWIVAHAPTADDCGNTRKIPREDEQQAEERPQKRPAQSSGAGDVPNAQHRGIPQRRGTVNVIEGGKVLADTGDTRSQGNERLRNHKREAGPGSPGSPGPASQCGHDVREGNGPWAVEPDVGRVAHGVPHRVDRLKQLGNAVVPQVVEQIGLAIMQVDSSLIKNL